MSKRLITMRTRLRTLYIHVWMLSYLLIVTIIITPWLWITVPKAKRAARARLCVRTLYQHFLRHAWGRRFTLDPFEFPPGPCILVANHQSSLDVILLMQFPFDARCWVKDWPFRVPALGRLIRTCNHLLIDDFNILPNALDCLSAGTGLYVFPEGARSRTGKMRRFHNGVFLLAARLGRPVIPVAIHGSHDLFPPKQAYVFSHPIRVQPLGVLWPNSAAAHPLLELRDRAWRMIAEALGQTREPVTAAPPLKPPEPVVVCETRS